VHSGTKTSISPSDGPSSRQVMPFTVAMLGGLLCFGLRRRRSRLWTALGLLLLIGTVCVLNACGGSSNSNDVAKGSYTMELDGTDTSNSSIANSTTFTVTVD
jgi:drug/metabolite transporter (DMT)-like permease